jgi:hypothetical protein
MRAAAFWKAACRRARDAINGSHRGNDRHSLFGELQDTEEEIWGAVSGVWRRQRPYGGQRGEVSNQVMEARAAGRVQ